MLPLLARNHLRRGGSAPPHLTCPFISVQGLTLSPSPARNSFQRGGIRHQQTAEARRESGARPCGKATITARAETLDVEKRPCAHWRQEPTVKRRGKTKQKLSLSQKTTRRNLAERKEAERKGGSLGGEGKPSRLWCCFLEVCARPTLAGWVVPPPLTKRWETRSTLCRIASGLVGFSTVPDAETFVALAPKD